MRCRARAPAGAHAVPGSWSGDGCEGYRAIFGDGWLILNAFPGDEKTGPGQSFDQALTKRERKILALLAKDLSNKQISDRLCISPATGRRHTENIRREPCMREGHKAVAKAMALAIIHPR